MIHRNANRWASGIPLRCALVALLVALAGCRQELPPPVEFYRGQAIPFGDHELEVYRVQKNRLGDSLVLQVYLRIDPNDALEKEWLVYLHKVELEDTSGKRYRPLGAMPVAAEQAKEWAMSGGADHAFHVLKDYSREIQHMIHSKHLPPDWNKWILAYQAPEDARPFSVYLENPDPRAEQPRAAIVQVVR